MLDASNCLLVAFILSRIPTAYADAAFQAWLQSLWPQAQALGVSRATFEAATRGLEPDLTLPDLVLPGRPEQPAAGQPEFVETPADYLKEAGRSTGSPRRAASSTRNIARRSRQSSANSACRRRFCSAIFGRETDYGRAADTRNAIRVLATQAYLGQRKDKFRDEFLSALKILDAGQVKLADMKSSWAGAMGLTQFLPSDYLKYAVDFDGTGYADIWNSVPDALASAAKQLRRRGLAARRGLGLRSARAGRRRLHPRRAGHHGARSATGSGADLCQPMAALLSAAERAAPASLVQPAGLYGPSFLATENYFAIKEYNYSDLYVLFVGHLSDRIADARPQTASFETPWGKVAQLPTADLIRMQQILTARGLYHDKIDGKAGMLTRAALGEYQKRNGLKVDCWPSAVVLARMEAH